MNIGPDLKISDKRVYKDNIYTWPREGTVSDYGTLTRMFDRSKVVHDDGAELHIIMHSSNTVRVEVMNLCQKGICFRCSDEFSLDELFNVSLVMKDSGAVVNCNGLIRHKESLNSDTCYGMQLFSAQEDEEIISNYILLREGEHSA